MSLQESPYDMSNPRPRPEPETLTRSELESEIAEVEGEIEFAVAHGAEALFLTMLRGKLQMFNAELQRRMAGSPAHNGEMPAPIDPGPYRIADGRICRVRFHEKAGEIVSPLCNFTAEVTQEIVLDDGAEPTRAFVIEGRLWDGTVLSPVRVPVTRFSAMNWPTEGWGLGAVVGAGQGSKDYLREAIQRLSSQPTQRRIFLHTGWREIAGKFIYLSGSTTTDNDYEVDLGGELSRYKLPSIVSGPVEAVRTSLRLLDLAPLRVTAPLWAACYRAPLVSAFPQDLSVWLEGRTGSMKSTLAALFLSHFGEFDRIHLPGTWASTVNQLERRAFILKDSLFVIDDYAPGSVDHREIESKAARYLRSQGNHSGRGRLKSDLTERHAFEPRGVTISTGEQHPPGQSLLARTLVIELDRNEITVDLLTEAQERSGQLSHAMAGYIAWLAPQMAGMPNLLLETFRGARTRATNGGEHLRIPEAAAHLWLGLDCALTYATEIEAVSHSRADELRKQCWEAFLETGREQGRIVEEEKPTRRFLEVLATIMVQGRALLLPKEETIPEPKPGVDFIGWHDGEFLYLLPEATFAAVVRFCRDTGEHFPTRQERLKRDLAKEGISECETGRFTNNLWVGRHTRRILKLKVDAIQTLLGAGIPTHSQSSHFWKGERDGV